MTIRLKVIDRKWTIVVHMRVKRQHQRWPLPYDPHASVAMTMDPAFVAFGTFAPTLHVQVVGRKRSPLPPDNPPGAKPLILVAPCCATGATLDSHGCCSAMNRAAHSALVAVALGLRRLSTACRSWAERPTCTQTDLPPTILVELSENERISLFFVSLCSHVNRQFLL